MTTAEMGHTERGAYITLGMMFGLMAGAAAGLLLAPQSGIESRAALKRKKEMLKQRAMTEMEKQREAAADTLHKMSEKTQDLARKSRRGGGDTDEDPGIPVNL